MSNVLVAGLEMDPIFIGIIAVAVVVLLIIIMSGYVKARPDQALIISGFRKTRTLIGRAGIKIPFLERKDTLSLALIPIDVKTSNAVPTADYININVDAAVNIKISDQKEKLELAAQNFLNKDSNYIASVAREVLEGNMREIVGRMTLEDMVSDRQKFAELVKENAAPDLAGMGLDIVSFNVQNFKDDQGVIENLGVDNVVKISKNAAVSRANAEKEIAVAQANAKKEANDAQVAAQTEIAIKQNELAIKQAELKKDADIKKAMADAATEIEAENQRKTIEVNKANADIARQEREIELKEKEVAVTEQTLEAQVKKQAEANKYAAEQKAQAELFQRQKDAEAKAYEAAKEADAQKAKAEAAKFAKIQEAEAVKAFGEAEAKAIEAKGQAEAEAIKAKGLAEAEAMEKKAEAYAKYNQAAITEMVIKALPEIAKNVAEPLTQIDKITIIGGGDNGGNGVNQVAGNVPLVMAKTFEAVKEATGVDLTEIVKAQTYDAKVTKNINVNGVENAETIAAVNESLKD